METTQASAYYANLSNFFARAPDWGPDSMPIVVGRIADQAELTYRTVVRTAQAGVVAGDGQAALIDTDAYGNDGLLYSTNGIVNMGPICTRRGRH